MESEDLERHDQGVIQVDLCFACAGIWFDHLVSVLLAPAAVIQLFKQIYAHRDDARRPVSNSLSCPRCGDALVLNFDLSKSGRFSYFACHRDGGRFTPFFQFLREKQFVRSLTAGELQRVRSQVRQITCSQCGAPIDLEHETECKYCHAPVSFLDSDAVQKALQMWSDSEARRGLAAVAPALGDARRIPGTEHPLSAQARLGDQLLMPVAGAPEFGGSGLGPDLVARGIHAIGRLFDVGI
jgi:hypothetical protein